MGVEEVRGAFSTLLAQAQAGEPLEGLLARWDEQWAELRQEEVDATLAGPEAVMAWLEEMALVRSEGERPLREWVLGHPALEEIDERYKPFVWLLKREQRLEVPANDAVFAEIEHKGQGWWMARRRWQPVADAYRAAPDEASWTALTHAWREVADEGNALWSELHGLRDKLAENAGFEDYVSFVWLQLDRSWSIDEADALCDRIEQHIVPALAALEGPRTPWHRRRESSPAPEDLLGTVMEQLRALDEHSVGDGLASQLSRVRVDLGGPGGAFLCYRPRDRESVVTMRPSGRKADLDTLAHELGHALHAQLSLSAAPMRAVPIPLEVAELASCGLERLLDGSDAAVLRSLRDICTAAAAHRFQRWAYANPGASTSERCERWKAEDAAFAPHYTARDEPGASWLSIPHLTLHPFYCLEYALANLGALGLRASFAQDRAGTVARYTDFLRAPPGTLAADAYRAAGLRLFPLDSDLREIASHADA